ncbi:MAG: DUF58 domain-containing protein [Acidobacteriota bacterium]
MARVQNHRQKPGARFLDPLVLARIDKLDLLAKTVVEGFINGLHRSPYFGISVDFAEHRAYTPGDDIRRLDWRLFARTDRFYVKQFEADSNTNFSTILDVSRSMTFTSGGISKLDYGRYLAACLTYFAHKQRDRVGLVTYDDRIVDYVPPSAKHMDVVLHAIDRIAPGGRSDLQAPILKVAEAARRKGILVLISDLYEEPATVLEALENLRFRGHDLIVFHLLDPAELRFEFNQAATYQDLETGESIPVVPDRLRQQYRELIEEHIDALSGRLGENLIDYNLIDTSTPLDQALVSYLSMRQKLSRVR